MDTCSRLKEPGGVDGRTSTSVVYRPHGAATAGAHHRQPSRLPRSRRICSRGTSPSPSRIWLADITYVEADQGWLYFATVMDLHSRKIVGWAMCDHLRAELPSTALPVLQSNPVVTRPSATSARSRWRPKQLNPVHFFGRRSGRVGWWQSWTPIEGQRLRRSADWC
jgi:transposase InsO family protein